MDTTTTTTTSTSFIGSRLREPSSYNAIGGILLTGSQSASGPVSLVLATLALVAFGAGWAMKEAVSGIAFHGILQDAIKVIAAAPVAVAPVVAVAMPNPPNPPNAPNLPNPPNAPNPTQPAVNP